MLKPYVNIKATNVNRKVSFATPSQQHKDGTKRVTGIEEPNNVNDNNVTEKPNNVYNMETSNADIIEDDPVRVDELPPMDGISKDERINLLIIELKRAKSSATNTFTKTKIRTTRERSNNKKINQMNQAEILELRKEIDKKIILVNIAQESETGLIKSYKTVKENFSKANNALKETKVMMQNMKDTISELERNSGHKDATIAGFKLRIEEGSRN